MRGRVSAVNSVFVGASNELGEFESGALGVLTGSYNFRQTVFQYPGAETSVLQIGSLEIEDPTVRISILERISSLLGGLNRVRALIAQKRKDLLGKELVAEFGVQFQLFSQTVANGLSTADTPERCDGELSKLMLQLEELAEKTLDKLAG